VQSFAVLKIIETIEKLQKNKTHSYLTKKPTKNRNNPIYSASLNMDLEIPLMIFFFPVHFCCLSFFRLNYASLLLQLNNSKRKKIEPD